jgi:SPP1 family predicted phage head-tail adaptor
MPYNDSRLRAGKLRHRIEIVKPYGPAQDSTGALNLANMSPVATVWASIEAVSGRDTLAAQQFGSICTHKITIRYLGNDQAAPLKITAQDAVWFKGRVFQILAALNPDERTKTLILLVVEVNDSQQQITSQPGDLA